MSPSKKKKDLFADDMILYVGNSKEPTKKLLELIINSVRHQDTWSIPKFHLYFDIPVMSSKSKQWEGQDWVLLGKRCNCHHRNSGICTCVLGSEFSMVLCFSLDTNLSDLSFHTVTSLVLLIVSTKTPNGHDYEQQVQLQEICMYTPQFGPQK